MGNTAAAAASAGVNLISDANSAAVRGSTARLSGGVKESHAGPTPSDRLTRR